MLEPWRTIIGEYVWPEATEQNPHLAAAILRQDAASARRGQGVTYPQLTHAFEDGGYQAVDVRPVLPESFWSFTCAAVADYLRCQRDGDYQVGPEHIDAIWPNVSRRGEYHRPHRHGAFDTIAVGTYYVQAPPSGPAGEGALSLIDPRSTLGGSNVYRQFYNDGEIRLPPLPGLLVVFPPHLLHYVAPHVHETPRISISFNVNIAVLKPRPAVASNVRGHLPLQENQ
jgi:hypothetical protein